MKYVVAGMVLVLFALSCSTIDRRLYSPTQVNNPSLKEKNDYTITAGYSSPSGFDLNGGYAITNRIAIIGGLYSYKNKDEEESFSIFSSNTFSSLLSYKHNGFHAGIGYYFPISNKKTPEFLSFFAGHTKGKFEMRESRQDVSDPNAIPPPKLNFYNSDINRWFIQGSYSLYNKFVHFSFITRFNYVGYNNVVTDYTTSEQMNFSLPDLGYSKWSPFIDFSFDTKFFFSAKQNFGAQFFGTLSARTKSEDFNFSTYPARIGIGLLLKSPLKIIEKKK